MMTGWTAQRVGCVFAVQDELGSRCRNVGRRARGGPGALARSDTPCRPCASRGGRRCASGKWRRYAPDARWQSFPGRHHPAQSTRPRPPRDKRAVGDCGPARAAPDRKPSARPDRACRPSTREQPIGALRLLGGAPDDAPHQKELRIVASMEFGIYGLHGDTYFTNRAGLSRSARRRESDIRTEIS